MQFWVLNLDNRAINFPEFQLVIQPRQKLNLLRRNSKITPEKINQSLASGTLKKVKNKIITSQHEIPLLNPEELTHATEAIFLPDRSIVQIEKSDHENLFTDEFLNGEEIDDDV